MRVTLIHGSNDIYGASKVLLDEVEAHTRLGHAVTVVVPSEGPLQAELWTRGISATVEVNPRLAVLRRSRIRDVLKFHLLPESIANADVVVLWTLALAPYAIPLLLRRQHFYLSVHEILVGRLGTALLRLFVTPFSYRIQACSHAVASWLTEHGVHRGRIEVTYPVLRSRVRARQLPNRPDRPFTVSVVGRLNGSKGHQELAEAFATALLRNRDWHLRLYGAPYPGQETSLGALLTCIATDNRITYCGEVSDFASIATSTDILACFPRKPESFGLVPIDGWLHNVPTCGWSMGGATEVLPIVGGYSVCRVNGSPSEIAEALVHAHNMWENGWELPDLGLVEPLFSLARREECARALVDGTEARAKSLRDPGVAQ